MRDLRPLAASVVASWGFVAAAAWLIFEGAHLARYLLAVVVLVVVAAATRPLIRCAAQRARALGGSFRG